MLPLPKVEMNVFETILARRSVRNYKARKVDSKTIDILLEAAVRAPTSMDEDSRGFIVIQDKKLLAEISDNAKNMFTDKIYHTYSQHAEYLVEELNKPGFNVFYNAGTLILIGANTLASYYVADCWLAAENFMLAASAMGLGTCVISSALPGLQLPEVRNKLKVPDNFSIIVPIILGYPDGTYTIVPHKKPKVLTIIPEASV